ALLEFGGGILIILGWLTRPIAALLAIDMVEAIRRVHWRNGLLGSSGFELPLALLGGCLSLVGTDPGKLSIDAILARKDTPSRRLRPNAVALPVRYLIPVVVGGLLLWRRRRHLPSSVA